MYLGHPDGVLPPNDRLATHTRGPLVDVESQGIVLLITNEPEGSVGENMPLAGRLAEAGGSRSI